MDFQFYSGELHTRSIHYFWLSNWPQVILSSKKKAIPSNNHAVKNQVDAMIRKELNWYFPYPPTLSISLSKCVNWKALSSSSCSFTVEVENISPSPSYYNLSLSRLCLGYYDIVSELMYVLFDYITKVNWLIITLFQLLYISFIFCKKKYIWWAD